MSLYPRYQLPVKIIMPSLIFSLFLARSLSQSLFYTFFFQMPIPSFDGNSSCRMVCPIMSSFFWRMAMVSLYMCMSLLDNWCKYSFCVRFCRFPPHPFSIISPSSFFFNLQSFLTFSSIRYPSAASNNSRDRSTLFISSTIWSGYRATPVSGWNSQW